MLGLMLGLLEDVHEGAGGLGGLVCAVLALEDEMLGGGELLVLEAPAVVCWAARMVENERTIANANQDRHIEASFLPHGFLQR